MANKATQDSIMLQQTTTDKPQNKHKNNLLDTG